MKKLEFCKPTKSVTGSWVTFGLTNDQEDEKKNGFYVNMLKQAGWNDQTKNGTFKDNVNNPEKHKRIKLSENDIAETLLVLQSNGAKKWSTVHAGKTPIFVEPFIKEENHVGYLIKLGGIGIALNFAETLRLQEYLKLTLQQIYL
jgi:hypothetical protein